VSGSPTEAPLLRGDAGERSAVLAAVAAACALALPIASLLGGSTRDPVATTAGCVVFLVAFPAGVTILRRFRHVPSAAPVAAGVVAVLAVSIGHPSLGEVVLRLLGASAVALAAAALAFRDRRDPLAAEIVGGMAAIGVQALVATVLPIRAWVAPLAVLGPAFVVASLGSRAVTVWDEPEVESRDRSRWRDRSRIGTIGYVAAVLGTAATAIRGGIWEQVGVVVEPLASVIVGILLVVLQAVLRPVFWFVQKLHVDPRAFEAFLRRLRRGAQTAPELHHQSGGLGPVIGRILGVAIVLSFGYLAYRVFRRFRPPEDPPDRPGVEAAPVTEAPLDDGTPLGSRRRRHELPADAVRRWYAEALLALRARHVDKEPAATPAEFLADLRDTHPALANDLSPLTRAYEDVRYGSVQLDERSLRELAARRRALQRSIRRLPRDGPPPSVPGS